MASVDWIKIISQEEISLMVMVLSVTIIALYPEIMLDMLCLKIVGRNHKNF